jgi:hypothetical protein
VRSIRFLNVKNRGKQEFPASQAYMSRTKANAIYWLILVDKPAPLARSRSWKNIEITFSRATIHGSTYFQGKAHSW